MMKTLSVCIVIALFAGCSTPPVAGGPTTLRDVAGDLTQQIEQYAGVPADMLLRWAAVVVGWIVALSLLAYVLPNPRRPTVVGLVVFLILFFAAGLPALLLLT